jgi:hypothetical protein
MARVSTYALIASSSELLYTVRVTIERLSAARWGRLVDECSGQIGSLLDLLQGHFLSRGHGGAGTA